MLLYDDEIDRENAEERIREAGLGAELVRRGELERLLAQMKAFYSHASLADIVALRTALDWREHSHGSSNCATLVEAFLAVLGIDTESA